MPISAGAGSAARIRRAAQAGRVDIVGHGRRGARTGRAAGIAERADRGREEQFSMDRIDTFRHRLSPFVTRHEYCIRMYNICQGLG